MLEDTRKFNPTLAGSRGQQDLFAERRAVYLNNVKTVSGCQYRAAPNSRG